MSINEHPTPNERDEPTDTGSLEALLDDIANFITWVGLAIAIIGVIVLFNIDAHPLIHGTFILKTAVTTLITILALKVVSEILRILKHQAGLPYTGPISKPLTKKILTCPKCHAHVSKSPCKICGQKISAPQ